MTLVPPLRRLVLMAHIASSLGWFGAVMAFLALAVAGLTSADTQAMRSAYWATGLVAWYVIVPFNAAALVTGVVQGLVSPWGLFRHYWVLVKLLLTLLATAFLVLHMQPISFMAEAAADGAVTGSALLGLRQQLVADAAAALVVLLVNTGLSVFKPQGLTRYGWRKQQERQHPAP